MKILNKQLTIDELKKMAADMFGDLIKAVVDVQQELISLNAELHSDLETLLLENGSQQQDLWGINLYPDLKGNDFVEFDSMINVRPSQGNMSRGVSDKIIQQKILEIVNKWIKQ